jgi:glycosyltransferase involved in cell wall biosynthesis
MILSICIPTYNRASCLINLFESLLLNEFLKNLEIIIVDDGSTDNTKNLINNYIHNNDINIVYHYQNNSGRGVALKKTIELATGNYIMLMDSDDLFLKNTIKEIFNIISSEVNLSGVVFLCQKKDNSIIGTKFPPNLNWSNLVKLYVDYRVTGDKKEIIRTDLMKKYLYTNKFNERRVPTSLLWASISRDNTFRLINKPIIIKDYLPEGMTKNLGKLKKSSPHGMYMMNKEKLLLLGYRSLNFRFKSLIGVVYYAILSLIKYKSL